MLNFAYELKEFLSRLKQEFKITRRNLLKIQSHYVASSLKYADAHFSFTQQKVLQNNNENNLSVKRAYILPLESDTFEVI